MRKIVSMVMVCMFWISVLSISAGATETMKISLEDLKQDSGVSVLATGSFNISVAPYGRSEANTALPLAAGETVNISAVYAPENSSMDFGLVDPDGVFHYFTVTGGSIDRTIRVSESGNYTFAVRNNSGVTVRVSGIINY